MSRQWGSQEAQEPAAMLIKAKACTFCPPVCVFRPTQRNSPMAPAFLTASVCRFQVESEVLPSLVLRVGLPEGFLAGQGLCRPKCRAWQS